VCVYVCVGAVLSSSGLTRVHFDVRASSNIIQDEDAFTEEEQAQLTGVLGLDER
jgi:hypothetical protein